MKKAFLFILTAGICLSGGRTAHAQERYLTVNLERINEADTLQFGWVDTEAPDIERAQALLQTYGELFTRRAQYLGAQASIQQAGGAERDAILSEQEAIWEGMRDSYTQMLRQQGLGAEERKELERQLADIDRQKEESRRAILEGLKDMADEGQQAVAGVDPSTFSDDRLMLIKRNLQKYLLGGRLWGFEKVRDFRNGFAAVARKDKNGDLHWGFVNRAGRLAIPCRWDDAFNFNNCRYYSLSVYDSPEDEDDRPWTTVRKGDCIGMIDTTGVVRIPVHFGYAKRAQLVFHKTGKGELAAARDLKSRKYGLIDRRGQWVIKPSYLYIEWDTEQACYYYENTNGDYLPMP